eukprot:1390572-Rhodomonas_salina.2
MAGWGSRAVRRATHPPPPHCSLSLLSRRGLRGGGGGGGGGGRVCPGVGGGWRVGALSAGAGSQQGSSLRACYAIPGTDKA